MADKLESRKRFMLAGVEENAFISIDKGAAAAIRAGGSLLPVGVTGCEGQFERGDILYIKGSQGQPCALGMVNYSSEETERIKGRHSDDIERVLGFAYGDEIIHHNNMTILAGVS